MQHPRFLKQLAGFAVAALAAVTSVKAEEVVRYTYNYVTPLQVIVKEKGFLDQELAKEGAKAEYILALGSNKGFEFVRGGSADFTASGASAALVARANGNPVRIVYYLSRGELMALVTLPNSGIKSAADLKGKRVAATPGTEPHYFLLRALESANLTERDIRLVPLIHPEGRLALVRGDVDAWAGLDPEMVKAEEQSGAVIFHRAPEILSGSVLVASDRFLESQPKLTEAVLRAHETARKWILDNPEETAKIIAKGAGLSEEAAAKALARLSFANPRVTPEGGQKIIAFSDLVKQNGDVRGNVDLDAVLVELLAPQYLDAVLEQK